MTENEAINVLQLNKPFTASKEANNAIEIAIQALEEIQRQKTKIGMFVTLEERMEISSRFAKLEQYEAIGTIEEFKAYKQGDCMNNCEHYDNCANYIYSKGYNQGTIDRAEELQKCREYGYNKAIDEFVNALINYQSQDEEYKSFSDVCYEIAERLKGVQE